jgi:hypothetical protein
MSHKDPLNELNTLLYSVARTAAVAESLGIPDEASQDEEFWRGQRNACRSRLFQMCLQRLNLDLALQKSELEPSQLCDVYRVARRLVDVEAVSATKVRQWYLAGGRILGQLAQDARREREGLQSKGLRVLLLPETGGALYLAYGEDGLPITVTSAADAYVFPVTAAVHLTKDYLNQLAEKNQGALTGGLPGVVIKQVKVLAGSR